MDAFTLTDTAGTFAFDGTQGVFTPADGSAPTTFTQSTTPAPTADPVVSGTVTTESGVVYNGTFTPAA